MDEKVYIIEVGPRDGLQNIKTFIPTEIKAEFVRLLVDAGVKELEVSSFVSTKSIPQLADAEKLFCMLEKKKGVVYSGLVPTLKGLERAINASVSKVVFFISVSDEFNRKNLNASISDTLKQFVVMKDVCNKRGIEIKVSISNCFYCPFTGYVEPVRVLKLLKILKNMGLSEFVLCDTTGTATPKDVEKLLFMINDKFGLNNFSLHMHNTYGFAIACIYKAFEIGIRKFEASAGGLGGCPNAPGATGNIATEVLCNFFEKMGVVTDISLEKIIKARDFIMKATSKNEKCITNM
jgi:hydroxymethylglutaryl-CoA lyase